MRQAGTAQRPQQQTIRCRPANSVAPGSLPFFLLLSAIASQLACTQLYAEGPSRFRIEDGPSNSIQGVCSPVIPVDLLHRAVVLALIQHCSHDGPTYQAADCSLRSQHRGTEGQQQHLLWPEWQPVQGPTRTAAMNDRQECSRWG